MQVFKSAVDEYCKSGYSIKIPATGNYTTSFILKDIDGDKINEAVAFYEPSNKVGTISMAVIKKAVSVGASLQMLTALLPM